MGPRAAAALSQDEGTYDEALLLIMERNGYPEETYYTFSYSPMPNDEGGIGGIFCANTDDTQRIIGERQLALLGDLAAATADARTIRDACALSAESLAMNPYDLPFAAIYLLDADHQDVVCAGTAGIAMGIPATPARARVEPGAPWPFAAALGGNHVPVDVTDLTALGPLPGGAWDIPPNRAVVLPIAPSGELGQAGVLVAGLNPYRLFDDGYRGFLALVAGQIGAAIANAQAYEAERQRAEALAELDRAKTAFFSNVSHEFRTPLTLLLGPLEDALGREELPGPAREELTLAHRNGLRLLKLVNTLLDFSRIEAGRVDAVYEPTDLAAVTADLASTFRSAVERAGLILTIDTPPLPAGREPVYVDREMWEKIVLNLLSNAFKFTLAGTITVALRWADDHVELDVADTGTGIPPEELPHLFERFHRVKGAAGRTHEGTGIGLALVQELVRLHGGRIAVASEPDRGTTFTVQLPAGHAHLPAGKVGAARTLTATALGALPYVEEAARWRTPAPDAAAGGAEPTVPGLADLPGGHPTTAPGGRAIRGRDGGPPRVLLADDNADMRDYVARLLGAQWRVTTVSDGQAALEAALADPPDLVLTDIMMPRLDGVGLLRALRAEPRTRALPVLLLSARAGEEASAEGLAAGADDYLTKPFTARELLARVGAHLAMAQMRREVVERERDQLERVFALSPTFLAVLRGPEHVFELANPAYIRLIGHRDVLGKPARAALPEVEGQGFFELLDELYQTGEPFVGNEVPVRIQKTAGATLEELYVNFVFQPMRDPGGEVSGILASGVDVTELVHARQAAHQLAAERDAERRRLETVLEQSPLGIGIAEAPSGRLIFLNTKVRELFGYAALSEDAETYGLDYKVFAPDGRPLEIEEFPIVRALHHGEVVENELLEIEHSSGHRRQLLANAAPVRDADGRTIAAVVIFWDTTDERRREQQLRDAQRLQSVGTLAGGVAHEVNNQMTAVLGFGAFALRALGPDHPQAADLRLVIQAGERAARITQQLLAFSRRQVTQPRVVDLHALTTELRPVLQHLLGSDKTLVIAARRGSGRTRVDPAQVEQVLINLVANARDATETGGQVTIGTEDVTVDGVTADADASAIDPRGTPAPGRYVRLTVSDAGHGMDAATAARIFEPFFTTKDVGQGTGLGLSMVHGIVKQHGGDIVVESQPGRGTTMKLYWPTMTEVDEVYARGASGEGEGEVREAPSSGTVLLVEDEAAVRQTAVRALEDAGFRVIAAENGEEALRIVDQRQLRPDLVVTDVIMPAMNGRQLGKAITARHPGVPVLYISGYTGDDVILRRLVPDGAPFLQKPFAPEGLVAAAARLMRGERSSAPRT